MMRSSRAKALWAARYARPQRQIGRQCSLPYIVTPIWPGSRVHVMSLPRMPSIHSPARKNYACACGLVCVGPPLAHPPNLKHSALRSLLLTHIMLLHPHGLYPLPHRRRNHQHSTTATTAAAATTTTTTTTTTIPPLAHSNSPAHRHHANPLCTEQAQRSLARLRPLAKTL